MSHEHFEPLSKNDPAFQKWFGVSRAVDQDGKPLKLYHGAKASFSVFDPEKSGANSDAPKGVFFFTDRPEVASSFTTRQYDPIKDKDSYQRHLYHEEGNVIPAYLSLQKPLVVDAKGENWQDILYRNNWYTTNELAEYAKRRKYDGVIIKNVGDRGLEWLENPVSNVYVAFHPNQVKSAIGNAGTYNPNNPDITKSEPSMTANYKQESPIPDGVYKVYLNGFEEGWGPYRRLHSRFLVHNGEVHHLEDHYGQMELVLPEGPITDRHVKQIMLMQHSPCYDVINEDDIQAGMHDDEVPEFDVGIVLPDARFWILDRGTVEPSKEMLVHGDVLIVDGAELSPEEAEALIARIESGTVLAEEVDFLEPSPFEDGIAKSEQALVKNEGEMTEREKDILQTVAPLVDDISYETRDQVAAILVNYLSPLSSPKRTLSVGFVDALVKLVFNKVQTNGTMFAALGRAVDSIGVQSLSDQAVIKISDAYSQPLDHFLDKLDAGNTEQLVLRSLSNTPRVLEHMKGDSDDWQTYSRDFVDKVLSFAATSSQQNLILRTLFKKTSRSFDDSLFDKSVSVIQGDPFWLGVGGLLSKAPLSPQKLDEACGIDENYAYYALQNPNIFPETLNKFASNIDLQDAILDNPKTQEPTLLKIIKNPREESVLAVALDRYTSKYRNVDKKPIMEYLLNSQYRESSTVAGFMADNAESIDDEIYERIKPMPAHLGFERVLVKALQKGNLSPETIQSEVESRDHVTTYRAAAQNPNTSSETLIGLLDPGLSSHVDPNAIWGSTETMSNILSHPNANEDLFRYVFSRTGGLQRELEEIVAVHPNAPSDIANEIVSRSGPLADFLNPDLIFNERVSVKHNFGTKRFGPNALRKLRDYAESVGGVIHKRDLEREGKHPGPALNPIQDPKGNITAESIQKFIDNLPGDDWNISHSEWKGIQRHSDADSKVLQINLTNDKIQRLREAGVLGAYRKIMSETSAYHPVTKSGVGWIRYTESDDPNNPGIFIDEIQTDLQNRQLYEGLFGSKGQGYMKKINNALFGNRHPNEILMETFQEHMRQAGKVGTRFAIHAPEPKAKLSGMRDTKNIPVHMKVTYQDIPTKMGLQPSEYGRVATQTNQNLIGTPTFEGEIRKKEESND